MTRAAIVPLESSRLFNYVSPVRCYLCEAENTYDAELCRVCAAPMALSRQAAAQKAPPRMVALLGPSAVGKTVYLGMLMDMLSQQPERWQILARGAFSVTLQQTTAAALARCQFPDKTPSEPERWNWVHCEVGLKRPRRALDLVVPDMAGEALLQEVDHPYSFRVIHAFLQKCAGAMILVDAERLSCGNREQDHFSMKLATYLGEVDDDARRGWRRKPVAVIFTKTDQCPACAADPEGFAKARAPGLWQQCRQRFRRSAFFAASVVGGSMVVESDEGRIAVPLRIEPRGVVEPFRWLLEQLR